MKRKKNIFRNKISNIFVLVALALLIVYELQSAVNYLKKNESLARQRDIIIQTPAPTPTSMPLETPAPTEENILTPPPTPTPPPPPRIYDFAGSRKKYNNDDIIGYLDIEDTDMKFWVTQKYKDNEFYLDHNIEKLPDNAGWIFLDYDNDISRQDRNTIIYGHNMRANIMFHALRYYMEEDYLKEHRYITFDTPYENCRWEVFSVYYTTTDFYYIQVDFRDDSDFENLINEMKRRSYFDTGVEVTKNDRILTLSTCSNLADDSRLVVNAKLIERHEVSDAYRYLEPTETPSEEQQVQAAVLYNE